MSSPCHHHVIPLGFALPTEEGEAEHRQRRPDLRGSSGDPNADPRPPGGPGAGRLLRAEE